MPCFEGTIIIFCSRLRIHRRISFKKVTLKSGCLKCNVWNTVSSTHIFEVLRAHYSIFLLGTKGTLKLLSRYMYVWQGAKKVIFTACHSGKLKLAFTSPEVISTSPNSFLTSRIDLTVLVIRIPQKTSPARQAT